MVAEKVQGKSESFSALGNGSSPWVQAVVFYYIRACPVWGLNHIVVNMNSCIMADLHVQFCENTGVKFPCENQLTIQFRTSWKIKRTVSEKYSMMTSRSCLLNASSTSFKVFVFISCLPVLLRIVLSPLNMRRATSRSDKRECRFRMQSI